MASGGNYVSKWCISLIAILPLVFSQSIVHFLREPFIGWARSYTDAIELPCGISDNFAIGSGHEVIWRRGSDRLFTNRNPTILASEDGRMSIIEPGGFNFTLRIKNPNYTDSNTYQCALEGVTSYPPPSPEDVEVKIGVFNNESVGCSIGNNVVTGWANDTCPKSTLYLKNSTGSVIAQTVSDEFTYNTSCSSSLSSQIVQYDQYVAARDGVLTLYVEQDQSVVVYTKVCEVTVESTTTTESTTGGPVPSTTPVSVKVPVPSGPGCGLICIILIILAVVVSLIISGVTGYFLWKKKCPCQQSSGNVPYEFEIDGVKEDKTIEISPGMPIRLAATCYGAKPPASIQWCISYNGKDPMDMTEKDYGNSDPLDTSVTTNKRDPETSDTHSKLEMVPNEDHDGAVIHCVAITKISADEEKWDLKTSPKITLKLKKGQVGDYPGQGGYYQGQGGDYRHQGGDYRGQDGYHQRQGGDNHGQGGNYHRHVGQAGQEYQPHGNTRNDKDPFPQPGKRPNALEPIQGQRTLTPIGDIEKTSFKKKRQTNKQTSEL